MVDNYLGKSVYYKTKKYDAYKPIFPENENNRITYSGTYKSIFDR